MTAGSFKRSHELAKGIMARWRLHEDAVEKWVLMFSYARRVRERMSPCWRERQKRVFLVFKSSYKKQKSLWGREIS